MPKSTEPISVRTTRLNNLILSHTNATSKTCKAVADALSREGLLDALTLLYNECNKEPLKKRDKQIFEFVSKYRPILLETQTLRISSDDFQIKTLIGKGYFGDVFLVSEETTGDVYAMKKIKKELITTSQVKEERDIMASRDNSEWITCLQYAFQDTNHLYLVMEYLPGGDLLSLMIRNGAFDEELAKFYLAELTLAINALHSMGYVHRDIKPENILIDRFGHIKLADFGNAAALNKDGQVMSLSPVGTPDYIAPELLQTISTHKASKSVHDVTCDYWSMGIIGYELVFETTPFHDDNVHETYSKILSFCDGKEPEVLTYPHDIKISEEFQSLIEGLIAKPKSRFTFFQIQKHPYFDGIDWDNLRQMVPPIIPNVNGDDDVSNFEDVERTKNRRSTFLKTTRTAGRANEFSGQDLPFIGYGFIHEEEIGVFGEQGADTAAPQINKLNAKIRELNRTVKNQTDDIKTLQDRLFGAEKKVTQTDSVNKILKDAKEELNNMKEILKDKIAELASSKTEIKTLRSSLKIEEEMRLKSDATISQVLSSTYQKWEKAKMLSDQNYEKQISEKKTEISNILQKLEVCESELKTKSDQCGHLQEKIENYKEMLKTIKDQSSTDKVEFDKSKTQMSEAYESKIAELQGKLRSERSNKSKLSDELRDVRSELDESICSTNSNRQAKLATEKNIEDMKQRLNKEIEENRNLRSKSAALQKKSDDFEKVCEHLRTEVEKLKQELQILEERRRSIELESGLSSPYRTAHGSLTDLHAVEEQLRNDLVAAKENEEAQRKRADQLENAVSKLEQMIARLSEQPKSVGDMLEKQNEKLEDKLTTAREQMIVERQAARTANLSLWKVEKQVEDLTHEKKMIQRRMDLTESKIKKVQCEKDEIEQKLKLQQNVLNQKDSKIDDLKEEIANLKADNQKEHKMWEKAEQERMKEKSEVIEHLSRVHKLEEKAEESKRKMLQALQKHDSINFENKRLLREVGEERERASNLSDNLQQLQMKLNQSQENYEMLKVACSITDTQLSEIEVMLDNEMKRNKESAEKIDHLWQNLRKKDEEIGKLKQSINTEAAAKIAAETKIKNLQHDMEEMRTSLESCHEKIVAQQTELIAKTTSLFESQEKTEVLSSDTTNLQTVNSNFSKEITILKEENTRILTDLFMAKEEGNKLSRELKEAKNVIAELRQELEQLNGTLLEQKNYNIQRDIKSEATIAQHKKLIDYLQLKVEDLSQKKKKTFADMIFGTGTASSKKENLSPNTIESTITYRTLQEELKRERLRNKSLKEELDKARASLHSTTKEPELSQQKHEEYASYREKEKTTRKSHEPEIKRTETNSSKHRTNQPHHFELTMENTENQTCNVCYRPILAGNSYWCCKECKSSIHRKCRSLASSNCDGFSTATIKSYRSDRSIDTAESISFCPSETNVFDCSADPGSQTYNGELILQTKMITPNLKINCAFEMCDEVVLFGCNSGLYAYHLETSELVQITGIDCVNYIAVSKKFSKAILVGSHGEYLYQCDLRHLQTRSQSIACLKPKLEATILDLPFANRAFNEKWHLVKISTESDDISESVAIAATSTRIVIMKYDLQLHRFKPVRALDTATAVSSILFTKHTAIVSSDKFFEIDLASYAAEEFLDMSDVSVGHTRTCQPMVAFRISAQEFLLCFTEFGIFVDEYGCRSRPYDLNWDYVPTGFIYREPLLYISHFQIVQVLRIHRSYSNEIQSSSDDEEQNYSRTCMNFYMPTLLAESRKLSVYMMAVEKESSNQQQVYVIDGVKALKTNTNVSLETLSSQATCVTVETSSVLSTDIN